MLTAVPLYVKAMKGILTVVLLFGVMLIVAGVICVLAIAVPAWIAIDTANQVTQDGSRTTGEEAGVTAELPEFSTSSTTVATPVSQAARAPGPEITAASLADYGTDKDTYQRGEQATGFVTVMNTGNTVINDILASVSASRIVPLLGKVSQKKEYTFEGQNIQPGEAKRLEFSMEIPAEYKGISTAGEYTFDVSVSTEAAEIGSFSQNVKVI
jgi:hypothetical protein